MLYQDAIKIIKETKTNKFYANGKPLRLIVGKNFNGDECIGLLKNGKRNRGLLLSADIVSTWNTLIPESQEQREKRDASNCIKLMFNPPLSSSRAMDKYFEEGEYTKRIVKIIKARAMKNKKLYDLCATQYPSILTA